MLVDLGRAGHGGGRRRVAAESAVGRAQLRELTWEEGAPRSRVCRHVRRWFLPTLLLLAACEEEPPREPERLSEAQAEEVHGLIAKARDAAQAHEDSVAEVVRGSEAVEPAPASPRPSGPALASAPAVESDTCGTQSAAIEMAPPAVFCEPPDAPCRFAGRVTELRPGILRPPGWLGAPAPPVTGTRVVLAMDECAPPVTLAGVRDSMDSGPIRGPEGPLVAEIFVATPIGYPAISFAMGQCVAGTVTRFGVGYSSAREAVLFRDGILVFAEAPELPRTPSPLEGWTFLRGALRRTQRTTEDYWLETYDMRVSHAGVIVELLAEEASSIEYGPERYLVEVGGYGTRGSLPPYVAWRQREGYGFLIVRDE